MDRIPPEIFDHVRIADGGCLEWIGHVDRRGYGRVRDPKTFGSKRRRIQAHRYAWEIVNGPIPDGLYACHKCDNRRCVNPAHLFLGTAADNAHDMFGKDRQAKGSRIGASVLREAQIPVIRARVAAGEPVPLVAADFGCSVSNVYLICQGKSWRHIPDAPTLDAKAG